MSSIYPSRMGKVWSDEEIQKLLQGVKKKLSHEELSVIHERTVGGIVSKLRELAANQYINDERPLDEIMKYTGLTEDVILDAIQRRQWSLERKAQKEAMKPSKSENPIKKNIVEVETPTNTLILNILSDIRNSLNELVELHKAAKVTEVPPSIKKLVVVPKLRELSNASQPQVQDDASPL